MIGWLLKTHHNPHYNPSLHLELIITLAITPRYTLSVEAYDRFRHVGLKMCNLLLSGKICTTCGGMMSKIGVLLSSS